MVVSATAINLGTFSVFFGVSVLLLLRGGQNDMFSGILVFMIALLQLFEFGVWRDQECIPGGSNNTASRGAYILFWLMPPILCFVAAFLASNVLYELNSRFFLIGAGLISLAFTISIILKTFKDRGYWCTSRGSGWVPIWFFQREKVPFKLNFVWLISMILPILCVDPVLLGSGTIVIGVISYMLGLMKDRYKNGEWLSTAMLYSNSVGIWAILVPFLRNFLFQPSITNISITKNRIIV